MDDEVTVQMRFAMAMTQADGDVCDEERALFYIDWLKRNGLAVAPAAYVAAMDALIPLLERVFAESIIEADLSDDIEAVLQSARAAKGEA